MRRLGAGGLWVAALVAAGVPAAAQDSRMTIAFGPNPDLRSHTLYDVEGSLRLVGFPGLPDTSVGSWAARVAVTRRVLEPLESAWVVQVSYDSSRAVYRTQPGGRTYPLDLPRGPLGPYRIFLDASLDRSPLDRAQDFDARAVRGLTGQLDFSLPGTALAARERWTGPMELPFTLELPGEPPTLITVTLSGRGTGMLDSVVARTADTLAYVSIRAGLSPVTVDTAYVEGSRAWPVTIWGSAGASLVWSTGWDAWVIGHTTLRMHARVEREMPDRPEQSFLADLTARFRLRP